MVRLNRNMVLLETERLILRNEKAEDIALTWSPRSLGSGLTLLQKKSPVSFKNKK